MKKTKINPYLKHLLKENVGYIVFFVGLLIATGVIISMLLSKLSENQTSIATLEKETAELQDKQNLLTSTTLESSINLDEDVKIMQTLIPDAEDYFSILYTLEQLSQKTGFLINSYTVNLTKSTANKLLVVVSGTGDADAFLKFLKEYNFGGGRLITTEKIELSSDESTGYKLNLTFYNKKISGQEEKNKNYRTSLDNFKKLKNKVSFNILPVPLSETSDLYPVKNNPF